MSPSAPPSADAPLSEGQRAAVIKLLADEDAEIYAQVRRRILAEGASVRDWLRPHTLSNDPLLRRRAQEIIQHLARQEADARFLTFCQRTGGDLPFEPGVWLLAATSYPDINAEAYGALLDSWAEQARERLPAEADMNTTLATVNELLFDRLGFRGNEDNYYEPDNSYLTRVIDRRTGNPISLCAIYLLIGRRLGLPVVGIGLPGHFLCRWQSSQAQLYVDAFNRGRLLSRADCVRYLHESGRPFDEEFLGPVSSRRILLRMCANLERIYEGLELREDLARLRRYVVALGKA